VAVSGAADVEHDLVLSHSAYVALVFAGPQIAASLLEAGIALASDVWDRRRLVLAGQAALCASLALVARTHGPWGLTVGLALAGTASGVACGAAQALVVVNDPRGAERAMVRWTLFASIGDMLTPIVTAASIALGFSFRGAMAAIASVVALQCAASAAKRPQARPSAAERPQARPSAAERPQARPSAGLRGARADAPDDEPPPTALREGLARARRRPRLWAWLFAAASCTLLDEIVVALAVLRMHREQGASAAFATSAAVAFAAGAVVGSAASDAAVARIGGQRLLLASAALCAAALGLALAARSPLATCGALFVVGVTCAPHHAIAFARAYDEMPGHPGAVQAISQLFIVIDIAAPVALGVVADRFGLGAAMAGLLLQPLIVLACAVWMPPPEPCERPR
jgi:MFS family permease